MTLTHQIAAGLRAAENPEHTRPRHALAITNDGDLTGGHTAVTQAVAAFDKLEADIAAAVERERASAHLVFSRIYESKSEVDSHVAEAVEKARREKYKEAADKLPGLMRDPLGWGDRARTTASIISSAAAYLTSKHGMDSSQDMANLVERAKSFGHAAFQVAVAECLVRRDTKLAAALSEVLNSNSNKRSQMKAAGITPEYIASGVVGDEFKKQRATLEVIIDGATKLADRHSAIVAYVQGTKASAATSAHSKLTAGLRKQSIERLSQ